ncbi:MAG: DUF3047 domain-containing protein [Denitromonas halophila]|uniref:DUF3047 domain-containing protein n=3 Tax=Denitromonas TaxID=139331 RepID=A0A557SIF0_9RHOO|nr:DUF3047 domain-containing protein [Denitromonas ohlonensis]TVO77191.1 DUF3047 domain-containing protein [Denitromonas ohlonensis]TVT78185.1 MAG: DUF3047 domain-containing protein [Denitromonas halophila]
MSGNTHAPCQSHCIRIRPPEPRFMSPRVIPRLCLSAALITPLGATALTTQPAPFTDAPTGTPPASWVYTQINKDLPGTDFSIVQESTGKVLRAYSKSAASSLVYTLPDAVTANTRLQWRWKVSEAVPKSAMANKATDDYAARVYVFFDYDKSRLPFTDRVKIDMARTLYGADLPTAALCYVWGTADAIGAIAPNPYTDRVRMIVLQRGDAKAGQWIAESRDLAADFQAAFGEPAPAVTGIALGADTDNTGATVEARFGDLQLVPIVQ